MQVIEFKNNGDLHIPFGLVVFCSVHDRLVPLGFVDDHLFDQTIEDLPNMHGSSVVEPEGVLVKVEDGKVVDHEDTWLSGVKGARFGMILPSTPLLGARYQQEVAPKAAMDRAEIVSRTETLQTPAGKFEQCLKTEESSALERGKAYNVYAPAIGLISDGNLKLTRYGRLGQ